MTNLKLEKVEVLILCLADPSISPRPRRVVELCLSAGYSVSVAGYKPSKDMDLKSFILINDLSKTIKGKLLKHFLFILAIFIPFDKLRNEIDSIRYGYHNIKKNLISNSYDFIIVEDLQLLPLAFNVRKHSKIIFDAREYFPRLYEDDIKFNLFGKRKYTHLCKQYLHLCDAVITVSEGIRDEYKKEFGVNSEVLMSTSYYHDIPVHPVNPDKIRIIYHGVANKNRQLEKMIEIFKLVDEKFYLDFVLVGNNRYINKLKKKAKQIPRIRFVEPVLYEDIIASFNKYDIGLLYYEPVFFNLKHCLPNKFFECIQSRLMIALGPSPDMAALVKKYDCGIVAKGYNVTDMAATLNSLTAEAIYNAKRNSSLAAKELCFEKESLKLLKIIESQLVIDNNNVKV